MSLIDTATREEPAADHSELIDALCRGIRERLTARRIVRATYRLQFTGAEFRFSDAKQIADYLARLGVSHIYSSPTLKSRAGSTHGYDVVDHTRLNDELGTEAEYADYTAALTANGLGQILDIVPNHMSVATHANHWWMDVLANGPSSPYAHYFDIDWSPAKPELHNRILLPVLGDLYGKTLESGHLPVKLQEGQFSVQCGDLHLPLSPRTWVQILQPGLEGLSESMGAESPEFLELQSIITGLLYLPERDEMSPERVVERRREQVVLQGRLHRLLEQSNEIREFVEGNLRTLNGEPGKPESFEALDRLLESQVYRLVLWKAGSDELNYRRFFDVTELAAVCTEHLNVFEATHQVPFQLLLQGSVDGFRIDHVDGLFDPAEYLWRLQWTYLRLLGRQELDRQSPDVAALWPEIEPQVLQRLRSDVGGPDPATLFLTAPQDASRSNSTEVDESTGPHSSIGKPLFVLVEKILGADEPLPPNWPVEGTTGYDFLNLLNGLFIEADGLRTLERSYVRYTDRRDSLRDIIYQSKRLVLSAAMQSEVSLLAHRLDRLSNRHRSTRDYTLQALRSAIRDIIASFPVYRTYIRGGQISERDRRVVQLAVATARRRNPAVDASVIQFVRDVLLLEQPPSLDEAGREERDSFIGRFQQVSSPVMAKGVEDTAFYRYVSLASLEEVGGEPGHAATSVSEFHRQNAARCREWPQAMLATSTHDTKRSEDLRARLNVLLEIPGDWQKAVSRWTRINRRFHRDVDGLPAPSRNDEWLFYQSLVGAWPLSPPSEADLLILIERLQQYMEKATREAKLNTSWISPNAAYDDAIRGFVTEVLSSSNTRFVSDLAAFHQSIVDSGLFNALSQLTLKLTAPGFPDIYQGQELWDFSLVDPDNRRPVDYELRRRLLDNVLVRSSAPESRLELCQELSANPHYDRLKLFVTTTLLHLRRSLPEVFRSGEYLPLEVDGERAEHVVAFARRHQLYPEQSVIVVVPRLVQRLRGATNSPPFGRDAWGDTRIVVNDAEGPAVSNQFTGATCAVRNGGLSVGEVLEHFPVAALTAAAMH